MIPSDVLAAQKPMPARFAAIHRVSHGAQRLEKPVMTRSWPTPSARRERGWLQRSQPQPIEWNQGRSTDFGRPTREAFARVFGPPYNQAVTEFDPGNRSAILTRDTSAAVERLQIQAWQRMAPLKKVEIMSQATSDALTLALSGIRQRHPGASDWECFIRLAALQLGPTLVRQVYPDAAQILGPYV